MEWTIETLNIKRVPKLNATSTNQLRVTSKEVLELTLQASSEYDSTISYSVQQGDRIVFMDSEMYAIISKIEPEILQFISENYPELFLKVANRSLILK